MIATGTRMRLSTGRTEAVVGVLALTLAATTITGAAHAADGPTIVTHAPGQTEASEAEVTDGVTSDVCAANLARSSEGLTAQNFETAMDQYDAWGATDFRVAADCKVKTVYIPGESWGGPATGVTISFHETSPSSPAMCQTSQRGPGPSFTVNVTKKCALHPGKIYWLVAQASQKWETSGQWFWDATSRRLGGPDLWQNPGDGFGSGCTTWAKVDSCLGFAYDFRFRITS